MVRVNLINPKYLADQHLVAEYLEIIMLVESARKHPNPKSIPESYKLGEGHINFFKDKLKYLAKRHELIKKEMKKRGFEVRKKLNLSGMRKSQIKDWNPKDPELKIIKKRLIERINKKPDWYRYYGKNIGRKKLVEMTKNAKLS